MLLKRSEIILRGSRCLSFQLSEHFENQRIQTHLLEQEPSETVELTKENGLKYYREMHLIRHTEYMIAELYRERRIRGFCHLYIGQEAISTGVCSILTPEDTVITSYRCHGWYISKGNSIVGLFGELLGNHLGASRGKGGSMHVYAPNFYGGNGIVGAHVPLGVGIALKHKYVNSNSVSVTVFGDGAYSQGQVHEAFNFAKLQNLPVLFVLENNFYGMGTCTNRSCANDQFYKASSYLPGLRADGMNILSIIASTQFALDYIRKGGGPILLELMTYRYQGHSMSDPGTSYRDHSEIETVRKQKDCLKFLANLLEDSNLATQEELKAIEDGNKKQISRDFALAEKGEAPSLTELTSDCYKTYSGKIKLPQIFNEITHVNIAGNKKMEKYLLQLCLLSRERPHKSLIFNSSLFLLTKSVFITPLSLLMDN